MLPQLLSAVGLARTPNTVDVGLDEPQTPEKLLFAAVVFRYTYSSFVNELCQVSHEVLVFVRDLQIIRPGGTPNP